jgi:hypothetical protein
MINFFKSLFKRNKIKSDKQKKDYENAIRRNNELSKMFDDSQNNLEELLHIYLPEYCYWGYYYGSLSEKERNQIEKKSPNIFNGILDEINLGDLLSGCKNKREKLKALKKWKKWGEEMGDLD